MKRRREMAYVAAALLVMAGVLGWAQAARATTAPCDVTGYLEASPGHVTGVFTVAETCAEVSVSSWLASDAHAGQPQTLYDHHSEHDVAPGDYRWTITAPPEGCFFQDDLDMPGGYTIDFILGGSEVCVPGTTTTTSTTSTSLVTSTTSQATTTTIPTSTSSTSTPPPLAPLSTISGSATDCRPTAANGTTAILGCSTPTEELAFSGGGELWALTLGALGLIGFGRWVTYRGMKRRH